jgi:hypothetical protein
MTCLVVLKCDPYSTRLSRHLSARRPGDFASKCCRIGNAEVRTLIVRRLITSAAQSIRSLTNSAHCQIDHCSRAFRAFRSANQLQNHPMMMVWTTSRIYGNTIHGIDYHVRLPVVEHIFVTMLRPPATMKPTTRHPTQRCTYQHHLPLRLSHFSPLIRGGVKFCVIFWCL